MQALALSLCLASIVTGQDPKRDKPEAPPTAQLYSFEQIERRLDDPNLRVLDARPRADYDKGHIPGAVWVDERAAQTLASKPDGLTDRNAWSEWVAPLAIGTETEVVVYDANRQLSAARIWWLLTYLGVRRVGLIDGGFPLWQQQGRPVTTDLPEVEPKPFEVSFRTDRHATRGDVLAALKDEQAQVLDARSRGEYTGDEAKSKRGGHIPGACHLEWKELVDDDGRFLSPEVLRSKLADAGLRRGSSVVSHCQGGGRASVNAFVLERLGYKARNYYRGWSDWGNVEETPVEK